MKMTNVLALFAGAAMTSSALAADVSRDEVRAIVAEALADAQTRSSLLQGGGAAGYDKGYYVASPNGDWKINMNGAIQFRYVMDARSSGSIPVFTVADDFSNGFQMRRAFLSFNGNMVNPNLEYVLRLVTDGTATNNAAWDDLYMRYNFGNGWKVKAGQFKGCFLKENSNSDVTTMASERGIMDHAFNPGRTQGVSASFEQNEWRACLEFTDGFNAIGSDFNDNPGAGFGARPFGESEMAGTARLEWLFQGKWDALRDYTSKPGDANSGYVGGAVHWEQSTNAITAANTTDWFGATIDAQWEGNGWGLFGAVALASANPDFGNNSTDWGACAQASYRWDEAPEVFVRWDGIFADSARGFNHNDMHFITFGFNNYFAGNSCKLTVDAVVSLEATDFSAAAAPGGAAGLSNTNFTPGGFNLGAPGGFNTGSGPATLNPGNGLQGSGKSGEFAVRAQWQVAF
jgi:hypothetical protein